MINASFSLRMHARYKIESNTRFALFCEITQGILVVLYGRLGTTCRSRLQGSRIEKEGPIGCPETSVKNYHCTPRNIPEERRSLLLRGGSLKS